MEISFRQPKQFLTKASGFLSDYTHTLNPYMGCQFGCHYCYVRKSPISLFSGKTWGEWVTVKEDISHQFKKELLRTQQKGPTTIFMSSSTDPYQPIEKKYEVTRQLLKVMRESPPDFLFIQTRGSLIQRDIDILSTYNGRYIVSMTIETDREDIVRHFTPHAPSIQSRLLTLKKLKQAHIPVQVAVAPVLPCTNQFAQTLKPYTNLVTVDDYFMGDGSNGRRTQALGIQSMYQLIGEDHWYHPEAYVYVSNLMKETFGENHVAISVDGFRPKS
ncbi:SPL family radical SAM protein [Staphylococcus hyicus]|uniref:SPL family radical SAM protein n=1 Tax=Staphylococcus hyicus TaxID=1284 RepID=UPI002366483D|nr:radical SAM protein [Staphylococcus hyicus]MDP4469537.1 radical SAM protein [Staphylococcus hyicus]